MRSRWLVNVTAYTVAGAMTSVLVGAVLGLLGSAVLPEQAVVASMIVAIAVALLATARTLGVLAIPFPQPTRQTNDVWVKSSTPTVAATRWGFDLGLIYTTRFTFPGIWFLTSLAVITQRPAFGACLFLAYWIGRTLSVWLGPSLLRDARETRQLMDAVQSQFPVFEKTHAVALLTGAAILIGLVGTGGGL